MSLQIQSYKLSRNSTVTQSRDLVDFNIKDHDRNTLNQLSRLCGKYGFKFTLNPSSGRIYVDVPSPTPFQRDVRKSLGARLWVAVKTGQCYR